MGFLPSAPPDSPAASRVGLANAAGSACQGLLLLGLGAAALWAADRAVGIAVGIRLSLPARYIVLREHAPDSVQRYRASPESQDGLDARESVLRADDDGFILPSRVHEKPDLEVVFLGGSTTECSFVPEPLRFPYLAGRLLEAKIGQRINAYNGGASSNTSVHSLDVLLNKVVKMRPRAVVFDHAFSDLTVLLHDGSYWNPSSDRFPLGSEPRSFPRWIWRGARRLLFPNIAEAVSSVRAINRLQGLLVERRLERSRRAAPAAGIESLRPQFEQNLRAFIALCRAYGIVPVLMTEPSRMTERPDPPVRLMSEYLAHHIGIGYEDLRRDLGLFNDSIREVGREERVRVIDLARRVPPDRAHFLDAIHYNARGSRLVAELIASDLAAWLPGK